MQLHGPLPAYPSYGGHGGVPVLSRRGDGGGGGGPPVSYRLADVGNGVWVGDLAACNACGSTFPNAIHIWRDGDRDERAICKANGKELSICYKEGGRLATMSVPIDAVVAYMRRPGPILIHCRGGSCRSTTLAILAKVARGCEVKAAIVEVFLSVLDAYGVVSLLFPEPIADICRLAEVSPPWQG
jgi:hypothetical protein